MPNGATSPISLAIDPGSLRDSIEDALVALATIHAIPATAAALTIVEDQLAYGRAAEFRVMSDGSCEIAVDPNQSPAPGLDALHELGHYVDWAVLPPTSAFGSASLPAEFDEWFVAVANSSACREMSRIATSPAFVGVTLADGTHVQLVEDAAHARYALQAPEVFARSYCQYIAVRSGNVTLRTELDLALQNHYPEQWRDEDFGPIADAIDGLLGGGDTP